MSLRWITMGVCARTAALGPKLVAIGAVVLAAAGCWDNNPCDPNEVERNYVCFPAPPPAADGGDAAAIDGEAAAGDGGQEAAAPGNWGATCSGPSDCTGASPVCPGSMYPHCTQLNCMPGEANAGVCPSGWTCITTTPGNPSICFQ